MDGRDKYFIVLNVSCMLSNEPDKFNYYCLSSARDNEDDTTFENFRQCIHVLAEKIGFLMRHRTELLEKIRKVEVANEQLKKELDENKELVKTLYTKHQLEKLVKITTTFRKFVSSVKRSKPALADNYNLMQANKEKISFVRFEVPEIAAFVLNSAGHYEAINRNCSNYYLSPESVALFTDHLPTRPNYIVGQIVHIERRVVKSSSRGDLVDHQQLTTDLGTDMLTLPPDSAANPYGLPSGCEYFMVTVAMLPNTAIHSTPTSPS